MGQNVLFVGKEYPDGGDFAIAATNHNRNAFITVNTMPENLDEGQISEGIYPVLWTRNTSLTARSLLLQAENICSSLQEAVLVFDTSWYSSSFPEMTLELCSKAIDSMIASYTFVVTELISRFKKRAGGTLVFVIKRAQTNEADNEGFSKPVSVLAGMAEGAFKGLGEAIATSYGQEGDIKVVLVKADYGTADSHFANWLFDVLDVPNSVVGKIDPKKGPQWFKMGTKTNKPSIFQGFPKSR